MGLPGASLSTTKSDYDPSQGIILGVQGSAVISGQLGYSFKTENFFGELGGGLPVGLSGTCVYCLGPFGPFDVRSK